MVPPHGVQDSRGEDQGSGRFPNSTEARLKSCRGQQNLSRETPSWQET